MIEIRRTVDACENEYLVFAGKIDANRDFPYRSDRLCARLLLPGSVQAYFELADTVTDTRAELIQYKAGTGLWKEMKSLRKDGSGPPETDTSGHCLHWTLVVRNISALTGEKTSPEVVVQIRSLYDLAVRDHKGQWWFPGDLHMHSKDGSF